MPHLVHGRAPQVVSRHRAARHAAREDVAAVDSVLVGGKWWAREGGGSGSSRGAGRALAQRGGERAVPEQRGAHAVGRRRWSAQVGLEVDVEGRVGTVPEGYFHLVGVLVGGPGIVNRVTRCEEAERDVGASVGSDKHYRLARRGFGLDFGQIVWKVAD